MLTPEQKEAVEWAAQCATWYCKGPYGPSPDPAAYSRHLKVLAHLEAAPSGEGVCECRQGDPDTCQYCQREFRQALAARPLEAAKQGEGVYIPGYLKCDKCNFGGMFSVLNTGSGKVTAKDVDSRHVCPNDGSDLRRVSWKERCKDWQELYEKLQPQPPASQGGEAWQPIESYPDCRIVWVTAPERFPYVAFKKDGVWWNHEDGGKMHFEPTHWQEQYRPEPLPAAPSVNKGE